MHEPEETLTGWVVEELWLDVEEAASFCSVEPEWLLSHLNDGLIPGAETVDGAWRLSSASFLRLRRMRGLERDFDASPELAALFADLLAEVDELRRMVQHSRGG